MKTCCVQNQAAVPLQTKQFHLYFKHLALQAGLEGDVLPRSARPLGKVAEVFSVLLGDARTRWGSAVGTTLSAPGSKTQKSLLGIECSFLCQLEYENETSKINTDVKKVVLPSPSHGLRLDVWLQQRGWARHSRDVQPCTP